MRLGGTGRPMAGPGPGPWLTEGSRGLGAGLHSRARHQVGLISHHPFLKSDRALPICLSPVVSYKVIAGRDFPPT